MTNKWSTDEKGTVGKICGYCKLWYPLRKDTPVKIGDKYVDTDSDLKRVI